MTYRELFYKATRLIDKGEITLGEYEKMTNPLDIEIEQEPRKGHWITQWNPAHQKEYYYCSECREEYSYDGETGIKMNDYNFCPNCGSDNREVKE